MPSDGSYMAIMTSSSSTEQAGLEAFFSLTPGVMDTLDNGNATNGSGIKTTIQVEAGDVVSFDWFFDADDYIPYNDFAFVIQEGAVIELADISEVGSYNATNWATYSFTVTSSGTLEIGFGVMNEGDSGVDSHLLIDNVLVNDAPPTDITDGNSSFESGDFTGWETTGDTAVVTEHDEGGGTGTTTFGAGYLYEFQVGESEIVADNVHGTDVEDGVTTQFTITSLPIIGGSSEQLGILLIDRGDDTVIEEIYGGSFGDLPAGGLDVQTGDSLYYFLEEGTFEVPTYDPKAGSIVLSYTQIVMLVDGLTIKNIKKRKRYHASF